MPGSWYERVNFGLLVAGGGDGLGGLLVLRRLDHHNLSELRGFCRRPAASRGLSAFVSQNVFIT